MQTSTRNRLLLMILPSIVLLVLAAVGLLGKPAFSELSRAAIAAGVLIYMVGMLAMLWAMQPTLKNLASAR